MKRLFSRTKRQKKGSAMRIQKLTLTALLVAMCFIGANIKIMGSIAFDAAPALVGTLLLGPVYGTALGFFGHMVSALLAGFPFSLPVHIVTAVMMAITMLAYGMTRNWAKNKLNGKVAIILSCIIAFLFNCPISLLAVYPWLKEGVIGLAPVLAIASVCNIIAAEIIFAALPATWKQKLAKK